MFLVPADFRAVAFASGGTVIQAKGTGTKAVSIVFSLPVTDTAGMRLLEELEEEE